MSNNTTITIPTTPSRIRDACVNACTADCDDAPRWFAWDCAGAVMGLSETNAADADDAAVEYVDGGSWTAYGKRGGSAGEWPIEVCDLLDVVARVYDDGYDDGDEIDVWDIMAEVAQTVTVTAELAADCGPGDEAQLVAVRAM